MGKFKKQPGKVSSTLKLTPKVTKSTEFKAKGIHRLAKTATQSIPTKPVNVVEKDDSIESGFPKRLPEKFTKKSTKGKGKVKRLTKVERQNLKKEKFLEKIQATQAAFVEDKAREKREKTEIIKDVKPLLDALPSLDSLFKFKNEKLKTGVLAYDKQKGKALVKQERREQKTKEFHEKLDMHKNLVQNFNALTPAQRREAIREATRRRKEKAQNGVQEDEKME